jgi:Beta-ketoacyl synthase, N-terminal domain
VNGAHAKADGSPSGPATPPVLALAVYGVGLLGPGLVDWPTGKACLDQTQRWLNQPTQVPAPALLPGNERRRAGSLVKASLGVADAACAAAGALASQLATVFTSSSGDPHNCHLLCEALAAPGRVVSPTRFTNSVHNAAAGYWHIATGCTQASTSLAAFDDSFAAGLLEAAVQALSTGQPVLLVACDVPYPEPLHHVRPIADVFAVALVLAPATPAAPAPSGHTGPTANPPLAWLDLSLVPHGPATVCADNGLEALRSGVPAARALPLLHALATATPAGRSLLLEGQNGQRLHLTVRAPSSRGR